MRSPTYCAVRAPEWGPPALSPELRRWTDTLLDPEVWEHSSDYKPPPASTVTRQYRTSAPLPDDFDACAVYVCLHPVSRNLDVVGEGWAIHQNNRFDPFAFEGLVTAASLPSSITNDRLRDVLALQQHLDHLESNQDYYSSLPGGDGDYYVEPGLSEARAAYEAAKETLIRDLFGPVPSSTVYVSIHSDGTFSIVGTDPSRADGPVHTTLTADLPFVVTNARLLEIWEAAEADKPELWAALLADIAAAKKT